MSGPTYRIKPLVWKHDKDGSQSVKTVLGRITVWKLEGEGWMWIGDHMTGARCRSLADGKRKAEAAWRKRLEQCLEVAP